MRVVAIGCGGHAVNNLWSGLRPAGLELVGVCARHLDRAEAAGARFGVAAAYDETAKMLESVEADAAIVAVPPDQYGTVLSACIDAGVAVLAEKPGAGSAEEAADLAASAREAGVAVVVAYQKRFASAVRQAKEIAGRQEFGAPTLGSFKWAMGAMGRGGQTTMRDWLFENPVHQFDLARHFLGEIGDLHVSALERSGEFALSITGVAESGAPVSMRACTTASWAQHNESLEIFGFGHAVVVDNMDTLVYRPPERPEQVWRPNYTVPLPANSSGAVMGFATELTELEGIVAGRLPNPSDLDSAAATLRLTSEIARLAGSAIGGAG